MLDNNAFADELEKTRIEMKTKLYQEYILEHMGKKCVEIKKCILEKPFEKRYAFSLSSEVTTKELLMIDSRLHVVLAVVLLLLGYASAIIGYPLSFFIISMVAIPLLVFLMQLLRINSRHSRCKKFMIIKTELENEFKNRLGLECRINDISETEIYVLNM